jgi:phosphatidate cytidylyltransferase
LSNTSVRVIVGLVGIPLIIFLALTGNYIFLVFCVLVALLCMNEFYNLFEKPKSNPGALTSWIGGISFHKAVFLIVSSLIVVSFYFEDFNYVLILYFMMFLFLIVVEVFKTDKHFEAIGTWLLSIIYISTPFGLLSLMGSAKFTSHFGAANYAIIVMALVWVSDTFAYFGGRTFGKHKMAERISPKKTWEGSIIGFLFTMIAGIVIKLIFYNMFTFGNILAVSLIAGIFAQIGDLFESNLKRSVQIKDSSQLIPGHGGFLDRFDSLLFAVPAVYIYLYLRATLH